MVKPVDVLLRARITNRVGVFKDVSQSLGFGANPGVLSLLSRLFKVAERSQYLLYISKKKTACKVVVVNVGSNVNV